MLQLLKNYLLFQLILLRTRGNDFVTVCERKRISARINIPRFSSFPTSRPFLISLIRRKEKGRKNAYAIWHTFIWCARKSAGSFSRALEALSMIIDQIGRENCNECASSSRDMQLIELVMTGWIILNYEYVCKDLKVSSAN